MRVSESLYRTYSSDAQVSLLGLKDSSILVRLLLEGSRSVVARAFGRRLTLTATAASLHSSRRSSVLLSIPQRPSPKQVPAEKRCRLAVHLGHLAALETRRVVQHVTQDAG